MSFKGYLLSFLQFWSVIYVIYVFSLMLPSGLFVISGVTYSFPLMCLIVIKSPKQLRGFSLYSNCMPPGQWQPVYLVIDSVTYSLPHPEARQLNDPFIYEYRHAPCH